MFLVERLFGIGVYASCLFFACVLLACSRIERKKILGFYLGALSAIAFFYEPYVTADLYRINEAMALFSALDFKAFWNLYAIDSSTPVARVLYWAVGKTGWFGLLPVIAVVTTYGCVFYILDRTASRYRISRMNVALGLFFLMATGAYFFAVSNVRSMMAAALICFCFFRETIEDKRSLLHLPIYFIAAFMHNMAAVLLFLRVVVFALRGEGSLLKRAIVFFVVSAACFALSIVFEPQVKEIVSKAYEYIAGDMYFYVWDYAIGVLVFLLQLAVLARLRGSRGGSAQLGEVKSLLISCLFVSLVLCYEFSIFYRFAACVAPMLSTPLLMVALQDEGGVSLRRRGSSFQSLVFLVLLLVFAIACTRGSLCGLKFFVL